jgi:hypothetical protein
MVRKYFRKVLPSHDALREHHFLRALGPRMHHPNLWHLNRRSVAGGLAVGLFTGLIPGSNPVQFTAAAIGAILFRVNLPLAVFVTLYSNPFTIVPLYLAAYTLGSWVMGPGDNGVPAMDFSLMGRPVVEWIPAALDWLASLGKPLLLGLPLLAILLAFTGYVLAWYGWRAGVMLAWRRRCLRRKNRA